ncbi:dipeptide/oligopeptide/nickel ABC transporter permease/ATP-binding protein [Dactylosporangium sp. CA-092794]|uniref:dipeptide/oligopeptide/nickel ABC transporter permease/ATP-binding protein n=1 Tax=Dactylosporangium sp. CA-092794 TaxID=3239929 RepID=UPI003D8FCD75
MAATRSTILLATTSILLAAVLGYALGLAAGLTGSRARRGVTLVLNLWLAFPPIVVALFVSTVLYQSTLSAVVAVALAYAPLFARTMLNLVTAVAGRDYVHVARMLGVGPMRRLSRHIAPNVSAPLWIQSTTGIGEAMVALSALSFLGLGVQPPAYDWGSLLAEYLERIFTSPLVVLGPALAITVVGVLFAFIGEAGALAMDPQRWTADAGKRASGKARGTAGPAPSAGPADGRPVPATRLRVVDLNVCFPGADGDAYVVRNVTFDVAAGEVVGIIGESGSGKSMTASAIARLVPRPGVVGAGVVELDGTDLAGDLDGALRRVMGTKVATVFQNPMSALTPTMRIGPQMCEGIRHHTGISRGQARDAALQALAEVQITGGERVLSMYPHQLSGGMRQRVAIAMGLMVRPALLIADEPTTALDVTIQQQILRLFQTLQREHDMAILFISHDFGVIREVCDRVLVMHRGEIVERLRVSDLETARHPYTRQLLAAVPSIDHPRTRPPARPSPDPSAGALTEART